MPRRMDVCTTFSVLGGLPFFDASGAGDTAMAALPRFAEAVAGDIGGAARLAGCRAPAAGVDIDRAPPAGFPGAVGDLPSGEDFTRLLRVRMAAPPGAGLTTGGGCFSDIGV